MLWRRREPTIDRETANNALAFIMRMDAKLDEILELLRDEDDDEPES